MILYQLVHGAGPLFDDTDIVGAASNPLITSMLVRAGEVLDAIQPTSTGTIKAIPGLEFTYTMPLHGGDGGAAYNVLIAAGDAIATVSGYTGTWFGWSCVLQLTITTQNGVVFGPFGSMDNSSNQVSFTLSAPIGQSVVAFSGTVIHVPLAGGGTTNIIARLNCSYA
jgi:hypothetical protein